MKLLERYATVCDLDIGNQFLLEQFYPLPNGVNKYITLQGSSGMQAKNYGFWGEVTSLINPYLSKLNISIIQLGGDKDIAIPGCTHLLGKTNFWQTNYIISRSAGHLGTDSWLQHRAGFLQKPLCALFGATSVDNHSAYNYDEKSTTFISSHRSNKNPSFQSQEQSPTINLIPPEQVAKAILKNLGILETITQQSLFFGSQYNNQMIEVIPDTFVGINDNNTSVFTVRMDIHFDENILAQLLNSGRKCAIVTNKPINPNLLNQFKSNIIAYNHEMVDGLLPSFEFVKIVKAIIPQNTWFSKEQDEKKLSNLRLKYFDICFIEKLTETTKQQALEGVRIFLNQKEFDLDGKLSKIKFKGGKFILSKSKIFISYAHLSADKSINNFTENTCDIIDNQEFWKDLNHFYLYEN